MPIPSGRIWHFYFASLIQLEGTARRVDALELNVHAEVASVPSNISAAIHLNDDDGLVPGSLLSESSPSEFLVTTDPLQRIAIDVPFVGVPDQFWVVASIPHNDPERLETPLIFREIRQEAFVGESYRNLIRSTNRDEFDDHGRLWAITVSAVPEPSTWGLLLAGLAAAGVLPWRRR